jgi:cellulose synthase/poly-beta-1,6-N-acetylglucosamine synthase-like glycosyltransferase
MYWFLTILTIPYIYMLIKIWYGLKQIVPFNFSTLPYIFVSVIVPCRNEQFRISDILKDLSDQLYPSDRFEVIIVDDNSTDRTYETANAVKTISNLSVIKTNGKGKKQALRTGIKASKGDLIITTDADCRIGNRWIITVASFYTEYLPQLIVCPVVLSGENNFFTGIQELEFLSLQGITAGTIAIGNPALCNGANLSFSKETYNNHLNNLFDEIGSGDDMFLMTSIKKDAGSKILWLESDNACISTRTSVNLRSFFKQRSRWFSKWKHYNDLYIFNLSVVTLATNLMIAGTVIAGLFQTRFLLLGAVLFLIKSLPDYLILKNTARRYKKENLLRYLIPAQLIYPFYILITLITSVLWKPKWK